MCSDTYNSNFHNSAVYKLHLEDGHVSREDTVSDGFTVHRVTSKVGSSGSGSLRTGNAGSQESLRNLRNRTKMYIK